MHVAVNQFLMFIVKHFTFYVMSIVKPICRGGLPSGRPYFIMPPKAAYRNFSLFTFHFSLFSLHCKKRLAAQSGVFCSYIFSGAEQPISVMPFFSTARAVSASFNLASSTFSASPLMRQAL